MQANDRLFITSIMLFIAMAFISAPEGYCGKKPNVGKSIKKGISKVGKGIGGAMKDAKKLLTETKKMMQCMPKMMKVLPHLMTHPTDKQAFNSLKKCIDNVQKMSRTCDKMEIVALSNVPNVGGGIASGCAVAGKYDAKLERLEDKMDQAENLASNPGGAAESMAMNEANAQASGMKRSASSQMSNSTKKRRKN